jgi:hypothetical protein
MRRRVSSVQLKYFVDKRVLFFNVNGSGLGHMNRCLAYARAISDRAKPYFFSLASGIEIIEEFGYEADYFVSPYWSDCDSYAWNCELAIRFRLMLELVNPDVVVFDGTWPFQGFLSAIKAFKDKPQLVWSNRGLFKKDIKQVPVPEELFDLVIVPGELGSRYAISQQGTCCKIIVPQVSLLSADEILMRSIARSELGIPFDEKSVLFSLGPGNLKDINSIGLGLVKQFINSGFKVYWAKPPITVKDPELPQGVSGITLYPLAKYLRAFDIFVGAAGYNTCCEVVQANVPCLLVPNDLVQDDQRLRANMVAQYTPTIVSSCETDEQQAEAVRQVIDLVGAVNERLCEMNGAQVAADAILKLVNC